jgi:SAM-dependent methyltransferase
VTYEARGHYQNPEVAARYDEQFRHVRSLSDLRAQVLGRFEVQAFQTLLANLEPRRCVLDVACGTGRYVRQLLDAGHRVTGTDVSAEMLTVARAATDPAPGLSFHQADAASLPFGDGEFDVVTCMRLYHRIAPELRVRMLREVKRVGRGWAILFFGMTNPWLRLRRKLRSFGRRPTNPHAQTMEDLERTLDSVGIVPVARRWVLPGLADGMIVLGRW